MNSYIAILGVSNGLFASKAAAFVATLAILGALIFAWRLWLLRREFPSRRIRVYCLLILLLGCLGGNRVSVLLFYRGLVPPLDLWPTLFSAGMGLALLGLAREYTRDYCGARGWLAALAAAVIASFFG